MPSEKVWGHRPPVLVFWKSWYLPVFWNEKKAGKRYSFSLPTMQFPLSPVSYTHLVHLVAGKLHKEIRETEQDNVGVESAHKSEEAVETGAYLVREGYRLSLIHI